MLSPRDTLKARRKRVQGFLDTGVPTVWIVDPATRPGYICTSSRTTEHTGGELHTEETQIRLPLEDLFATLAAWHSPQADRQGSGVRPPRRLRTTIPWTP